MIPKSERLTRKEIDAFFTKGPEGEQTRRTKRVIHTPSFFVVALRAESFKAGVTVPKKAYKSAVDRNRLRRIVYDALRDNGFTSLPYHLLISIKKGQGDISRDLVLSEVRELYKKIRV